MNHFMVFLGKRRPSLETAVGDRLTIDAFEQLEGVVRVLRIEVDSVEQCPDCFIIKGSVDFDGKKKRVRIDMSLRNSANDVIKVY